MYGVGTRDFLAILSFQAKPVDISHSALRDQAMVLCGEDTVKIPHVFS